MNANAFQGITRASLPVVKRGVLKMTWPGKSSTPSNFYLVYRNYEARVNPLVIDLHYLLPFRRG